jgi:DNA polymerase sigma
VAANPGAAHSQHVAQEAAEMEAKYQSVFLAPEWNEDSIQPLEWMLRDVYGALQPTEEDYFRRIHVIQRLSNLFQSLDGCKGADVMPFGSFESNFYTPWGDLDLSLELPVLEDQAPAVPKSRKVKILRSIERALLKSGTSDHHISRNFLLPYCSSW